MPLDPLTDAAETLAPAPSNTRYFDPAPGASILARYGQSGRALEGMAEDARNLSTINRANLEQRQMDRYDLDRQQQDESFRRRMQLADREDLEYADKQAARDAEGGFLISLSRDLDPDAPDYDSKRNDLIASMPRGVIESPAVKAILSAKDSQYGKAEQSRLRVGEIEARNQGQIERIRANQSMNLGLKGVTPEMVKAATGPDGEVDWPSIYYKAGTLERQYKEGEFDRQEGVKQEDRKELKRAKELIEGDTEAFQPHKAALTEQKGGGAMSFSQVAKTYPEDAQKATDWDSKRVQHEISTAAAAKTPEDYIKLAKDTLTPDQKQKRREIWELAHNKAPQTAEPAATAPQAVAPTVAAPQQPVDRKPMTPEIIAAFIKKAGGDRRKAMEMSIAEGY